MARIQLVHRTELQHHLKPSRQYGLQVQLYAVVVHSHHLHFTVLLSPIAENYFITPWGAEGRVVFGIPQGMCCAACVKAAAARHSEQAHKHTYSAAVTTLSDSAELMLITVVLVVVLLLRPL